MSGLPHRSPISICHIDIKSYLVTFLAGLTGGGVRVEAVERHGVGRGRVAHEQAARVVAVLGDGPGPAPHNRGEGRGGAVVLVVVAQVEFESNV